MTLAQQYFLTTAEEKSIARAARQLNISQQNLSRTIKRLEETYGLLFVRRPQFHLTPSGAALYASLLKIRSIEENLETQLKDLQGQAGHIRMGIHSNRANVLIPSVIERLRPAFPDLQLDLTFGHTRIFSDMLKRGDLDIFLGLNADKSPELEFTHLAKERLYYVCREDLLRKAGLDPYASEYSVKQVSSLPLFLNPQTSNTRTSAERLLQMLGTSRPEVTIIPDYQLQLRLASMGEGSCFCPGMLLVYLNTFPSPEGLRLCPVPITELSQARQISLVTAAGAYKSSAMKALIRATRAEIEKLVP